MARPAFSKGFTLLELLVAITVSSILLVIGIPAFMQMIAGNQRSANSADLYSDLAFARAEAISRNLQVGVCPSDDGASCADGGDWRQGWLIYANTDNSTAGAEPDADEAVLASHGEIEGQFSLTASGMTTPILFLPSGRSRSDGRFELCPDDPDLKGRAVEITSTGRPRIANLDCGA